jgi:hypothetical protein
MKLNSSGHRLAAVLGAALLGFAAAPAIAANANVELLQDYIGDWRGRGVLVGAETESVVCRLNLSNGNEEKVNYSGRCSLAGTNLSVSGTMAWNEDTKRYEAAMTSNVTFTGLAIGKRQGDALVFNLREQDKDEKGNDLTISADISLRKEKINVDFLVLFNTSGDTLKASVPFTR